MCLLRHDTTSRENMRLVTIKEVYLSFLKKNFKFLQLLCLTCIELRWGATFRAFSYTSMSCVNTNKKRLKVYSLASLPKAFCPASLPTKAWSTLYQGGNQYLLWRWISYLYRMLHPLWVEVSQRKDVKKFNIFRMIDRDNHFEDSYNYESINNPKIPDFLEQNFCRYPKRQLSYLTILAYTGIGKSGRYA